MKLRAVFLPFLVGAARDTLDDPPDPSMFRTSWIRPRCFPPSLMAHHWVDYWVGRKPSAIDRLQGQQTSEYIADFNNQR